ncbi:hypothetical protein AB5J55_43550 [Streptomyces sp. R11]|uniref:Uncharacterized protein n=1 Tax=Streptomyces sp. R11 TaxID=3238625 RepID=A0AB39NC09_9ACTN
MGFIEAFAYVLSCEEQRRALYSDPHRVQAHFALTEAELETLLSASAVNVDITAELIRDKRWRLVTYVFPTVTRLLAAEGVNFNSKKYLSEVVPTVQKSDAAGLMTEATAFVEWLTLHPPNGIPAAIVDVADHELACFRLGANPRAAVAAREWRENQERESVDRKRPLGFEKSLLTASLTVRTDTYRWDVVEACQGGWADIGVQSIEPRATSILLQKVWPDVRPVISRIGAVTRSMIERSDGTCTGREIVRSVSTHASDERILETLRALVARGVLIPSRVLE